MGEEKNATLFPHSLPPAAGETAASGVMRVGGLALPLTIHSTQESMPELSPGQLTRTSPADSLLCHGMTRVGKICPSLTLATCGKANICPYPSPTTTVWRVGPVPRLGKAVELFLWYECDELDTRL